MKIAIIIFAIAFILAWISFWWESKNAPTEDDNDN